jgi:hypothetical protein
VEHPYLPLLCTKFAHGQHELTMLVVLGQSSAGPRSVPVFSACDTYHGLRC